jgi:hypothetical protein
MLIKDRDALLAFYDFPAEHRKHLRATNVIESSFATISSSVGFDTSFDWVRGPNDPSRPRRVPARSALAPHHVHRRSVAMTTQIAANLIVLALTAALLWHVLAH